MEMSHENFLTLLKEKLATASIKAVKRDVELFEVLDNWTNEYSLKLADW